jgi:hypothetical protein
MDRYSKILTDKWKDIIESINVNGYSRKVECVNCFIMYNRYVGYPEIEICYKVIFDFRDPKINQSLQDCQYHLQSLRIFS